MRDNYYQKRMVKVFKALSEHKLDKAAKYWEDIKNKSVKDKDIDPNTEITKQLYPLWQLSECMMMNIKDGRGKSVQCLPYDPWGAYRQLRSLYNDSYDLATVDLFFADERNLKLTVKDIKAGIEKNLVDSVRKVRTEAIYDELLDMLFDCSEQGALRDEREQVAYDGIKYSLELEKCQGYLDKYKDFNKSHFSVIEWRRDSLAYERLDSTAASCQHYLDLYPASQFRSAVEEQLHHCAFNEMAATVEACREYIDKYPDSRFIHRVKNLEQEYAYRDAKEKNTVGAYYSFITDYPESEFIEEAGKQMQQVFQQHYFNNHITFAELYVYCHAANKINQIKDASVKALYDNLLLMTTSAVMNSCDGLTGEVTLTTSSVGSESEEKLIFNQQGLLIRRFNLSTGQSDDYTYDFDSSFGFKLISKTDTHGKMVSYTTKWNDNGSLAEVKGSDGSRVVYLDSEEYWKKIMYYKGTGLIRTDCYDNKYRLVKSLLPNNVTIEYGYNPQGDVTSMMRIRGTEVIEECTYEYDYYENPETGRHWSTMSQFKDAKLMLTKVRHFYQTVNRVQSDSRQHYEIDWNFENEPVIVSEKDLQRYSSGH